jgi:hypothetical protein
MAQGRPGRPPLAAKREQFRRLIARGVGNAEASRLDRPGADASSGLPVGDPDQEGCRTEPYASVRC